jgi:D-alanine-D-alanine ligase
VRKQKLRVGLIFGGRSVEHEISLGSAASIMDALDRRKYEIVPIYITRKGIWSLGIEPDQLIITDEQDATQRATIDKQAEALAVTLIGDSAQHRLIPLQRSKPFLDPGPLDVIFPALHGPYGEDGTLQGLLEMTGIPYVGCGVLGSSLGMDKEKMKMIIQAIGLPTLPYLVCRRYQWERSPEATMDAIEQHLGYPCFVKPANLGSSIGISKAHHRHELQQALHLADHYDWKIITERAINCSELECAVLGNDTPIASAVGEVIVQSEFYDYATQYFHHEKIQKIIPSHIPHPVAETVRYQAIQAFVALDLSGLARIDFFQEKETGLLYFNEVNTFPSFSPLGAYAQLWLASGISYVDLLDRLIELALGRHHNRQRHLTSL